MNSGPYTGLSSEDALAKMTADAEAGGFGRGETTYRLQRLGHFPATILGHADSHYLLREATAWFPCRTINCLWCCPPMSL